MEANSDLSDEELLDWKLEAGAVIRDIKNFVKEIFIDEELITEHWICINLKTFEDKTYCVELSNSGFRIVGDEFSKRNGETEGPWYDTPYALLTVVSPSFQSRFSEEISRKLQRLENYHFD